MSKFNSMLTVIMGFPCGSAGKESACNVRDMGSIPRLWRSPGEGKGYPLQYSGLENSMDCIVHGVAKSQTWLSDFHLTVVIQFTSGRSLFQEETSSIGIHCWLHIFLVIFAVLNCFSKIPTLMVLCHCCNIQFIFVLVVLMKTN